MGWGETKDRGSGTTGEIEQAHRELDDLGIPGGSLATRTLQMITRFEMLLEEARRGW